MYDVTLDGPGLAGLTFFVDRPGELRNIVWAAAHAQGKPVTDDSEMIHTVGALRSACDNTGEGTLEVHAITVAVRDAEDCEGHAGEDGVLLGGPEVCDGSCRPRRRFTKNAAFALMCAVDDAELDEAGGCGPCGLEAGQMCAACGKCNCDTHEACVRPTQG